MLFKDVIGQEELIAHLIQEVKNDKISHAKLFLGNVGYGGLPLALAFVQYLFCEQKSENDSCNVCPSCLKLNKFEHADVHFSFPVVQALSKFSDHFIKDWREQLLKNPYFDLNLWTNLIDDKGRKPIIGTEESVSIIKKLSLKSFEGKYKVMIIWLAEEMNSTCANKLLKILEEPPNKTIFILIASNQEYMLQTILSRTQIVNIPAIQVESLAKKISEIYEVDNSSSMSIASLSEGDYIEAQELMNDNENKNVYRDLFIELMRVCYKKDVIAMIDWSEKASNLGKERQKIFLKYALHMFRQSILKNYTDNQLTKLSKEEEEFLIKFSRFVTGSNIFEFMENFNESYYQIERNANAKILFTNLCFKVMKYIHVA
jgi:DNA polymerase III subunit delta'